MYARMHHVQLPAVAMLLLTQQLRDEYQYSYGFISLSIISTCLYESKCIYLLNTNSHRNSLGNSAINQLQSLVVEHVKNRTIYRHQAIIMYCIYYCVAYVCRISVLSNISYCIACYFILKSCNVSQKATLTHCGFNCIYIWGIIS